MALFTTIKTSLGSLKIFFDVSSNLPDLKFFLKINIFFIFVAADIHFFNLLKKFLTKLILIFFLLFLTTIKLEQNFLLIFAFCTAKSK